MRGHPTLSDTPHSTLITILLSHFIVSCHRGLLEGVEPGPLWWARGAALCLTGHFILYSRHLILYRELDVFNVHDSRSLCSQHERTLKIAFQSQ